MTEPGLAVSGDAVDLMVDQMAFLAERAGRPSDEAHTVSVVTTDPERSLDLVVDADGVRVSVAGDDTASAGLSLPAESFIRLVYGRLDPDHTPASVTATGIDLDLLRRTFPGV